MDELDFIARKPLVQSTPVLDDNIALRACLKYLHSPAALASIDVDAYWPKWNGPWWQMMLLFEMGRVAEIPPQVIDKILQAFDSYYLDFFPFTEDAVPSGRDPLLHVACHCQMGTIYQLLTSYGVNIDERYPWMRPWFIRYQMNDGGLNCDEAAYVREVPRSSVVSTLPVLEAVLHCTPREFTEAEVGFLNRGAQFLIQKRIFRRASTGKAIDESWTKLCFPRFYHYDVLRGLNFLLRWSVKLRTQIPISAIAETIQLIDASFPSGTVFVQRDAWGGNMSRWFNAKDSTWFRAPAASFPLLELVSREGAESPYLTKIWNDTRDTLKTLIDENLIETSEVVK